jgi:hypothetical protein
VQSRDGDGPGEVTYGRRFSAWFCGRDTVFFWRLIWLQIQTMFLSSIYVPKGLNQKSHTNVGSNSSEEHVRLQLGAWDWNIHTYWHMTNGIDNCANCKQMKKKQNIYDPFPSIANTRNCNCLSRKTSHMVYPSWAGAAGEGLRPSRAGAADEERLRAMIS